MNINMKPILFLQPVMKEMLWGGDRLRTEYHYETPSDHTGESWIVCARENGDCIIKGGTYAGKTLSELWTEYPALFGNREQSQFPLLVKIIDAKTDLSVQVHPDDAYARQHEKDTTGKNEFWYILDCGENAALGIGHNAKTKEELHSMVAAGEWERLLRKVPIQRGDYIQIDAGTIHAITKGALILEVQQNCDITYRVYDYDRLDKGRKRELHVDKSLDVITVPSKRIEDTVQGTDHFKANQMNQMIRCEYYKVWKLNVEGTFLLPQEYPFLLLSVIEGEGSIDGIRICKGDSLILPAQYGTAELTGKLELVLSAI